MELLNREEFVSYIKSNYKFFLEASEVNKIDIPDYCDSCKREVFLKIHSKQYNATAYPKTDPADLLVLYIQCPACRRMSYLFLVSIVTYALDEDGDETSKIINRELYKIFWLPTSESDISVKNIPSKYNSLIITLKEAIFCFQNGKNISAVIMFRRALQIITQNVLGAKKSTLFHELEWLKNNPNNLGISLTSIFHDHSDIVRRVGNQAAHPEDDPDLQNFSSEDAKALNDLIDIIIHEIFTVPALLKKAKEELKINRKL